MDANVTDLRIVKTRTNIKNSLIDLLAEKNVSKITVTELAEKAMINRKPFTAIITRFRMLSMISITI